MTSIIGKTVELFFSDGQRVSKRCATIESVDADYYTIRTGQVQELIPKTRIVRVEVLDDS